MSIDVKGTCVRGRRCGRWLGYVWLGVGEMAVGDGGATRRQQCLVPAGAGVARRRGDETTRQGGVGYLCVVHNRLGHNGRDLELALGSRHGFANGSVKDGDGGR